MVAYHFALVPCSEQKFPVHGTMGCIMLHEYSRFYSEREANGVFSSWATWASLEHYSIFYIYSVILDNGALCIIGLRRDKYDNDMLVCI